MAAVAAYLGSINNDPLLHVGSLAENRFVQRLGQATGLACLPAHFHEALLATAFYTLVYVGSGVLAPYFVPSYRQLSHKHRLGFDSHVVSHVNALLLCALSLPMYFNPRLDTLVSYVPYGGLVAATAVGYFIWDLYFTVRHFQHNGIGYTAHAATALFVFAQALRPFMFNYAAPFIWFEASTPFVNVHWFASRVPGMFRETTRKLNGLVLLLVFFVFRIVSGPYYGYGMFREVWQNPPRSVPTWAAAGVFVSYLTLVGLNFLWFSKMIQLALRTFAPAKQSKARVPTADTRELNEEDALASGAATAAHLPTNIPGTRAKVSSPRKRKV